MRSGASRSADRTSAGQERRRAATREIDLDSQTLRKAARAVDGLTRPSRDHALERQRLPATTSRRRSPKRPERGTQAVTGIASIFARTGTFIAVSTAQELRTTSGAQLSSANGGAGVGSSSRPSSSSRFLRWLGGIGGRAERPVPKLPPLSRPGPPHAGRKARAPSNGGGYAGTRAVLHLPDCKEARSDRPRPGRGG